jgi:two-component system, cell cycle sensor histidine kinase and response regulator CckA
MQSGQNDARAGNLSKADDEQGCLQTSLFNLSDAIIRTSMDGFWLADKQARILQVNEAYCRMSGYSKQELLTMKISDLLVVESPADIEARIQNVISHGEARFESRHRRKDGSLFDVEVSSCYRDGLLFIFTRDITGRKRAEETLKESEERFRIAFDNAPTGMSIIAPDGRSYLAVNPLLCEMFGYTKEEFSGNDIYLVTHPDDAQRSEEWVRKKINKEPCERDFEKRYLHKDGHIVWGQVRAQWIYNSDGTRKMCIVHILDITDRKKAEAEKAGLESQLIHSQKMEALGTLAGGIAHDFNNLLMGISGYSSMMMYELDKNHPHYEKLKCIEAQIQSATELTRQLLGLALGGKYEVKPADLNEIILQSSDIFGRTKKEITVHLNLQEDLCSAEVDRGQIEQVLLNIFVNAWHAMPLGGDLYITTENIVMDERYCESQGVTPGTYLKLSITDTGIGMDEETRLRVFEPFFSTKEKGMGTGLGLASAYGIIKNHGGFITVYSEKGRGSTFNICLPASGKEVLRETQAFQDIVKGAGTILLVDDQEIVAAVGAEMLNMLGYETLVAHGGREALELYEARKDCIQLVILDMIMPGFSGEETFDRLRLINPEVRVILSSGYSLNGQAARILARGCSAFIQKPFNLQDLSIQIQRQMQP